MPTNELIRQYIAGDGGARLELTDDMILDGQATTKNQNSILFLAYLSKAVGPNPIITAAAIKHEHIVKVAKGRYLRRKGEPLRQSHDNVLAWCWISVKIPVLDYVAKDIYDWAKWRLFVYDPNKRFSLDPRCLLQGSQVFFLKLAAGKKPGWLSTIWACGAALVQDHASGPYLLSMLESDILEARRSLLSPLKQRLVNYSMGLLDKRREGLKRWFREYFQDQNHPAILAAEENNL
jgi:hypothetical protein